MTLKKGIRIDFVCSCRSESVSSDARRLRGVLRDAGANNTRDVADSAPCGGEDRELILGLFEGARAGACEQRKHVEPRVPQPNPARIRGHGGRDDGLDPVLPARPLCVEPELKPRVVVHAHLRIGEVRARWGWGQLREPAVDVLGRVARGKGGRWCGG